MQHSFLITGASGQQGGATARALLSEGAKVHAFVRDPTSEACLALRSQGAEIFKGDMLDIDSLRTAMVGVTGVFLNTFGLPPNPYIPDTQIQQAENVISAALQTGTVMTMVVSTVICTDRHLEWADETPNYPLASYYGTKHRVEDLVRRAGFAHHTILRPAWLMHNYLTFMPKYNWPDLETKHELAVSYAPTTKLGHLSPRDVGKFATAALLNPDRFNKHEIDLASENLTLAEVAEKLSVASGIEIKTRFRSAEETSGIDSTTVPGIIYQRYMMKIPTVYEADLSIAKQYDISLTSFAEYFAGGKENEELQETLGALFKKG